MATGSAAPDRSDGGSEPNSLPRALLRELELALRSIRYGEIQLVVHNGRVVQLEKREKVRLQNDLTSQ